MLDDGKERMEEVRRLNKKARGQRINVYEDPVTRLKLEGVGVVRTVSIPSWADPGYFVARVQFEDGIFVRTVHESSLLSAPLKGAPGDSLDRILIRMKCPKCKRKVNAVPGSNCGDCLMEHMEIIPLEAVDIQPSKRAKT